jgi:hypothetical protein
MKPDASECKFYVQNALKLTFKHPEIPQNFLGSLSLAIKGREQQRRGGEGRGGEGRGGRGGGGEGRGGEGRTDGGEEDLDASVPLVLQLRLHHCLAPF